MRSTPLTTAALCCVVASLASLGLAGDRLPTAPLSEVRSIDGTGNNEREPLFGSVDVPFLRLTAADYADGVSAPSGGDRPSARAISNAVCAQDGDLPNAAGASDFLWQWGQFLDHDITATPVLEPAEAFDIAVPTGDVWFDPFGTGVASIPLDRSYSELVDGVAEQVNEITAYIDASNVYGSDEERAAALRTLDGTGRLRTSDGGMLPYNEAGLPNAPSSDAAYYLAGDFRANEQVGLTALHALFVREHNYWADRIRRGSSLEARRVLRALERRPRRRGGGRRGRDRDADTGIELGSAAETASEALTGDEVYELARAIVGAEMQAITYREFLPVLLGEDALAPYEGYRDDVDPGITNEFATAAYRVGHTMLSSTLRRVDRRGRTIEAGDLALRDAFFDPTQLVDNGGLEPVLRGLASQRAQTIDTRLVDDVRNLLFGPPGSGGFDLAALNIQRGRDHGLADYGSVRAELGLSAVESFADVTSDAELAASLETTYGSVDDVDLWIGGLAEDTVDGALVGETFRAILVDQFEALRDGDRFWYEVALPEELVRIVERQTLSRIIRRNTRIGRELQRDVFRVRERRSRRR